jgi:hypothetical protein
VRASVCGVAAVARSSASTASFLDCSRSRASLVESAAAVRWSAVIAASPATAEYLTRHERGKGLDEIHAEKRISIAYEGRLNWGRITILAKGGTM